MQYNFDQQLIALKRNQRLLIIGVLFFVLVLVWTFVSLFSSQKATVTPPELIKLAAPLSPTLDTETLDTLTDKRSFSDEELARFPIYKIIVFNSGKSDAVVSIDTTAEEVEAKTGRVTPTPVPTQASTSTGTGIFGSSPSPTLQ